MNKMRFFSTVFTLLLAIGFTSCDSEPVDTELVGGQTTPGTNTPAGPAVFKADFNNQTFTATTAMALKTEAFMTIQGIRGTNGEMFNIVIEGTTTGTYNDALMTYDPNNASEYTYTNVNPDLDGAQEGGTVTITSINTVNKTISGTFSFTGYWSDDSAMLPSINFTNGTFSNVPYTDQGTPGTGTTDYLKATVNGQAIDYSNNIITAIAGSPEATLSINGTTSNGNKLNLYIKESLAVGSYPISGGFLDDVRAEVINSTGEYDATAGTLMIISKQNNTITGTFQFEAGSVTVTNGSFRIEYDE